MEATLGSMVLILIIFLEGSSIFSFNLLCHKINYMACVFGWNKPFLEWLHSKSQISRSTLNHTL